MAARVEIRITAVLALLTVTSGVIDAVSFLALGHAFAALATGNLLLLAFGLTGSAGLSIARPALALVSFVLGAAGAHLVITRRRAHGQHWFALGLLAESALLATAGGYAVATGGSGLPPSRDSGVVFALVSLAMGWRSRFILAARIPEMPTTLVQTTLIKLVVDLFTPHAPSSTTSLTRVQRLSTVLGMFAGGLLGAAALPGGPGAVLLAVAGCVAAVGLVYSRAPRLRPPLPEPSR
ncbi:hypothetical protein GCM10009665_38050 [Kitasatospora nipponensis]|uniref:DUF1275 domain-containing protein n=1 Tax=Kitasatospora nipponensis TaxID=258049 RepID=A0ABN1WDE5_9ACTN